jgi:hypothetical protein
MYNSALEHRLEVSHCSEHLIISPPTSPERDRSLKRPFRPPLSIGCRSTEQFETKWDLGHGSMGSHSTLKTGTVRMSEA